MLLDRQTELILFILLPLLHCTLLIVQASSCVLTTHSGLPSMLKSLDI